MRVHKPRLTDAERAERNAAIIRDCESGMSRAAVAALHGVSDVRVHQILKAAGAPVRPHVRRQATPSAPLPPRLSMREEIAERLRELRANR